MTKEVEFRVRLPNLLYMRLFSSALAHMRAMDSELEVRLERSLAETGFTLIPRSHEDKRETNI